MRRNTEATFARAIATFIGPGIIVMMLCMYARLRGTTAVTGDWIEKAECEASLALRDVPSIIHGRASDISATWTPGYHCPSTASLVTHWPSHCMTRLYMYTVSRYCCTFHRTPLRADHRSTLRGNSVEFCIFHNTDIILTRIKEPCRMCGKTPMACRPRVGWWIYR